MAKKKRKNPSPAARASQEWLNERMRELVRLGLSGVQAADRAYQELEQLKKIEKRIKKGPKLAKKANPAMASIGFLPGLANPLGKKKNASGKTKKPRRGKGGTKLIVAGVPVEHLMKHPDYAKAAKAFARLHGSKGTKVDVYERPDGRDDSEFLIVIGDSPELHYEFNRGESNKNNYHWVHKTAKGHQLVMVYNPFTKEISYLPPVTGKEGTRVDDWLREYNE
jgi:hypothetical protein